MKILSFIFCIGFCLNVFATPQSGIFIVVKGTIFIENSKGEKVQAKVKSVVNPGDTVVSEENSRAKIIMSDRNVINILPNTKIKFEKYTNEPGDKNVEINILEGRIKLDVQEKYDDKTSRFQIKSSIAVAAIRGTELIFAHQSSTNTSEVDVISGEVQVLKIGTLTDVLGFGVNGKVFVRKQQRLVVNKASKAVKVETLKPKAFEALKEETDVIDENAKDSGSKSGTNN